MILRTPYPYFGGKSRIMPAVWRRLGSVQNFVSPFFGGGSDLLLRPVACGAKPNADWPDCFGTETVNDIDGLLCNFWRALQHAPDEVAYYADYPVNEIDLHARHRHLVANRAYVDALIADPDQYDAKLAGWWVWGISQWIGSGWCPVDATSVSPQMPLMSRPGRGVHALSRKRPAIGGRGTASAVGGVHAHSDLYTYFDLLSQRLRRVRVCSGDWQRVVTPSVTTGHGLTAVFLDPPYEQTGRADVYAFEHDVFAATREWAIENADNPLLRIAICGYDFDMPDGWTPLRWNANGGYGNQSNGRGRTNAGREVIWFSPHCLRDETPRTMSMFEEELCTK